MKSVRWGPFFAFSLPRGAARTPAPRQLRHVRDTGTDV